MATILAGTLAIGVHSIADESGDKAEPVILGASVFLLASAATFSRFIPIVKTRFDYGVTIFILTYSLVSVSGYRVDRLLDLAHQRLSTIAIGGSMCIIISLVICPVWAGEELHSLISKNMEKLATSLEGCVAEYFDGNESVSRKEDESQCSQAYKCVLNSKTTEESFANFARWEPAHGQFAFRHPWKQYLKIGSSMRYCAYCVEALNSAINSEIKAPELIKNHLRDACMKLSSHSSNVLRKLSATTKSLRKSSSVDDLVSEMNSAVEDLQEVLKSLPQNLLPIPIEAEDKEQKPPISTTSLPLIEVLPLLTVTSLLIEISTRIEGVVGAVNELGQLVNFKPATTDKPQKNQASNKPLSEREGSEVPKAFQLV